MDFTSFSSGSIDFSPHPTIKKVTVVLDEPELRTAHADQIIRFWNVWHKDRKNFAPKLTELTIVCRPGWENGQAILSGINRFLDHYRHYVEPECNTRGLYVYTDCYSAISEGTRFHVQQAPIHMFSVSK